MGVVETWYCDFHDPDEASDYVHEDTARDGGWLVLYRTATIDGMSGRYTETGHLCPECQEGNFIDLPDLAQRLRDEGWGAGYGGGQGHRKVRQILEQGAAA